MFSTALAKGRILNIAFTAGAMKSCGNGAIQTEVLVGINLGTACANAAFCAELSATLTVTLRAIGAVHTVVYGTFDADDVAPLLTAVVTGRTTIYALSALLAPLLHNKIALVTVWAVGAFVRGAFFTKAQTVNTGAFYIHVHAIGAKHTFLAPVLHFKIALTAAGAMGIFVRGAFFTKAQTVNTGALYIHVHAIGAKHTFLAPVLDFKIALVAAGTVGAFVRGAFFTKNRPVSGGAFFVNDDAIGAHTALLAPLLHNKIALVTTGTVCALFKSALQTHIVANLLGGAAVANLRA